MTMRSIAILTIPIFMLACSGSGKGGGKGGASGMGGIVAGSGGAGSGGIVPGSSGATGAGGKIVGNGGATGAGGTNTVGSCIACRYPGDVGIDKDPDVVWTENFEEGTVAALLARYEDKKPDGLALDGDVPPNSSGNASGKLTASGAGPNAVDFFKNLAPGYEELFVRYYAKYQAGVEWHHTGVWLAGYNPASNWPNPQAGLKPNGDDRFHVALEPVEQGATPRMDFYNYWMKMHSWMAEPSGDTAYYGNSLVHDPGLVAKEAWQCFEIHVKLNPTPSSGLDAELGLWVDDRAVMEFTDEGPLGYWVRDKFCSDTATGRECTDYRPDSPLLLRLDLQYRSTTQLKITAIWPQNYITSGGAGSVWYDDMVAAKSRVGCIR
jgi:hypothetical protein